MATHWGVEGVVKVGSVTIAEVTQFEVTSSVAPVVDTSLGDTWETHIASSGIKSWSGSLTCHWDETDTTGQGALTIGASVTLNLYPEGSTTGDIYYSGTASITELGVSVTEGDTIKRTFSFKGNGALVESTV